MIITYIILATLITACKAFNETHPYMFRATIRNFWFKPADHYYLDYDHSTLHLCIGAERDPEGLSPRLPSEERDCEYLSHKQNIKFMEKTNISAVSFSRWPTVGYIDYTNNGFTTVFVEITLNHNTSIDCEERNKEYEMEGILEADCDNIDERPFCGFGEGDDRDFITEMNELRSDKDPKMFTFSSFFLVLSCILAVILFVLFVMGTRSRFFRRNSADVGLKIRNV